MSLDPSVPNQPAPPKCAVPPSAGEVIASLATGTTYVIGEQVGEGSFGMVFGCTDGWRNDLAVKVMKPVRSYEEVHAATLGEVQRLLLLRHPHITYVYDAFEYRDTFYVVTERCYCPLTSLFTLPNFNGLLWLMPIARCVLQAVQYLHVNQYAHQDIHLNNVFAAFARNEMKDDDPGAILFKLGDLGVTKLFSELDAANTLAEWIRPPEARDPAEYGPLDHRIDIYHLGLLFLQLAYSREIRFTVEEIMDGRPRELALQLPTPLNFALEKALRRHAALRTASAEELWRDLQSPPGLPDSTVEGGNPDAPTSVEPDAQPSDVARAPESAG